MRQPTPDAELYAWWTAAVTGERMPTHEDEPHAGYFKRRLFARGPFIPASIFVMREVDDAGELVSDETLHCEVNGVLADIEDEWLWLARFPISRAEYEDLKIMAQEMMA